MAMLDASAIELASSLSVEAVPAKLRCGSCNKLAINAVKLPCCDQSICEPCSRDLPETCPICGHSPLSAEDCKPNRSLRMTVKAFVKSEEKKRSKEIETQAPPASGLILPDLPAQLSDEKSPTQVDASADTATGDVDKPTVTARGPIDAFREKEVPSAESSAKRNTAAEADAYQQEEDDDDDDDDDVVITTEKPEREVHLEAIAEEHHMHAPNPDNNRNHTNAPQVFDPNQNQHGFGHMDFNPMGFNPMSMQNGVGMGGFPIGMPNMIGAYQELLNLKQRSMLRDAKFEGMPGMNMDPSAMFGGGGGFGNGMGMGMNDLTSMMNMGMGLGPQTGFFPGHGGYNHQNFGNQMNQSFHHNRGYGRPYGRGGYGRGRNGYGYSRGGRGGWQNYPNHHQSHGQSQYMNQQQQNAQQVGPYDDGTQAVEPRGSPRYEPMKSVDGTTNDSNVLQRRDNAGDDAASMHDEGSKDTGENVADQNAFPDVAIEEDQVAECDTVYKHVPNEQNAKLPPSGDIQALKITDNEPVPLHDQNDMWMGLAQDRQNAAYSSTPQQHPNTQISHNHDYSTPGHGYQYGGRGSTQWKNSAYGSVTTISEVEIAAPAPPINAPTGPKAMRAGLPNSGIYSRSIAHTSAPAVPRPTVPPSTEQGPITERGRSEEDSMQVQRESRDRSASKSNSRSPRRVKKSRAYSPGDDYESDDTYKRRKDRERRKRRDRERRYADDSDGNGDRTTGRVRSRSQTPGGGHSKRRGGREKNEERRSHRERSRDRRKHRDRSLSPERGGDGNDVYSHPRHKSKSDRKHGEQLNFELGIDQDRTRKHSIRDELYDSIKSRIRESSSRNATSRSSRGEGRHRDRNRDRDHERTKKNGPDQVPEDDIGFSIKGRSKTKTAYRSSMAPPSSTLKASELNNISRRGSVHDSTVSPTMPTTGDNSYAEERMQRELARMKKHENLTSGRSNSLGKRVIREVEDEREVPLGPKGYTDGVRKEKRPRPMSYKYEDELGESDDRWDEREGRRWR